MPEDNIPNNYRQEADRPSNLRPVDLHKASHGSYTSSQFTPPAAPSASAPASSPPMGGDDLPLDLSVKPTAAPAHEKKARPEESPYGDRRMSHNDVDPRDRHSGQAAYPIQSLEDSMERNLPYQQQPSYPHQNYYHHSTSSSSSTSSSAKLPSPALPPQHGSNDGPPPPPHQQHHSSSNPEGKYYPGLHHTSSSSSSSSSLPYPHPKHVESPTGQPHPHPHNTSYPQQYQSPHGYNNNSSNNNNTTTPPNRGSSSSPANSSLLSLPPHLRRNSGNSSSGGEHQAQDNAKSYFRQGGSPYSDSNHQPIKPDMDLPMPRLYQPPRNLEDCPPHLSSRPSIPPPDNKNGDYPSQNPQHHQQQQQRQPPPLMKPATQPPPPSPQQQQQSGGTNPNSNPSNPNSNPDDMDNLKHISRHEPIQNIIGNHPQNDILYLICKLCRQTYGSPYGFRKHFRNQHGFEPKVEHTIVQTISATKTAMGHNNIPEGCGGFDESKYRHSEDGNGNPIPYPLDQAIKLEIPDNYTMDEFNSSQLAAYNRAQEHVKIIFKQSAAGEDGSGNMENAKVLECPECGQTFQLNDFGSYKRHCRQHSMVPNAGPFSCHDCHRSFAEPGQLEQHLNTHNTFTPSVCGICRTFFSSPHYLAEHLQAAHGHVLPSEMSKNSATNKLEPPAGEHSVSTVKQEKPSPDMPQVFQTMDLQSRIERALMLENDLENATNPNADANRSSSRSPVDSRSSSNNNNNSSSSSSSVAPKRLSPSLASLPPTKRHRMSTSNSCSPPSAASMLTVVTPKQLDIQKRPADPVVASASPDSSFDDRSKLTTSKATTTTSITSAAAASSDTGNSAASNNSSNTNSPIPSRDANTTPIPSGRRSGDSTKSSTKSPSLADMKSYVTGKGGNESDRCASVESSNSDSNQSASVASSPGLVDESQMYYKHKKYSRHLKRRLSNDTNNSSSGGTGAAAGGAEPSTPTSDSKMPKLDTCDTNSSSSRSGEKDGKSTPPTLSSSSSSSSTSSSAVTSSVNSSVRKEDCQSSSSISSSSKSSHSKGSKSGSRNSSRSSTPNSSKEDKDSMKSSDKPHAKDKSDKAKNKDNDSKKKSECKV